MTGFVIFKVYHMSVSSRKEKKMNNKVKSKRKNIRPFEYRDCLAKEGCKRKSCKGCPYLPDGKKYYEGGE